MSLGADRSYKMKLRDVENAFKYRRIPYPKRSVELIALLAISCTFFLFMHTNKLNSRLKEMEVKLQPSEFSALGLTSNHVSGHDAGKHDDINTLHGTYQYLKSTGQILQLNAQDLNNTPKADIDVLFFNRVPKTGSMQLIELMRQLGKVHDYEVEKDPQNGGVLPILELPEQSDMIENIVNLEDGTVFASHVNYLNFTKNEQPRPIYINMVRDPVDRVVSWYYYIRAPWIFVPGRRRSNREMPNPKWVNTEYDQCVLSGEKVCTYIEGSLLEHVGDHRRQTLFFCGHDEFKCTPFNSRLALQIAKLNVEREYAVVGTWEHTNETLAVLEAYVPRYFADASKMYYSGLHEEKQNDNPMKPHISQEILDMVRRNFTREIEFYQFCRQRLHKQYLALKLNDLRRVDKSLVQLEAANDMAIRN
ncbi:heparan sulfate 2-O-sulfotransferase pipe-like isoform X2 [Drosophila miranda]|uniref:heparan sulfate 2-O-sulfotransferase pipe-like isoform X2 n=1 Tax=Drosophila miranda TaxID=7229 RepID=UPI0007E66657|nr:heparan sulfate 2-O-sulfotransferase pipe-like isoform X2 [Drosophila miranda]